MTVGCRQSFTSRLVFYVTRRRVFYAGGSFMPPGLIHRRVFYAAGSFMPPAASSP